MTTPLPDCPHCRSCTVGPRMIIVHSDQSGWPPEGRKRFAITCHLCGVQGPTGDSQESAETMWREWAEHLAKASTPAPLFTPNHGSGLPANASQLQLSAGGASQIGAKKASVVDRCAVWDAVDHYLDLLMRAPREQGPSATPEELKAARLAVNATIDACAAAGAPSDEAPAWFEQAMSRVLRTDPHAVPSHVLDTFITSLLGELGEPPFLLLPERRIEAMQKVMLGVIAWRQELKKRRGDG